MDQGHSSSPALIVRNIGPFPSTTKLSLPTEHHHHLTQSSTSPLAGPSSTKDPSSLSKLHSSSSPPKALSTPPEPDLGTKLHLQLPQHLQRLVSPLFVDPYTDPASVPRPYQPRLTSAKFRELFRDDYETYVALKPKDSLPSLFDLEMTSVPETDLPKPKDPAWVKARLKLYGLHQGDDAAYNRYPAIGKAVESIINAPRDSSPTADEVAVFTAKLEKYRTQNEDTYLRHILPLLLRESRQVPATQLTTPIQVPTTPVQHTSPIVSEAPESMYCFGTLKVQPPLSPKTVHGFHHVIEPKPRVITSTLHFGITFDEVLKKEFDRRDIPQDKLHGPVKIPLRLFKDTAGKAVEEWKKELAQEMALSSPSSGYGSDGESGGKSMDDKVKDPDYSG
ncbi:MAG: hypothetical protein Q9222_001951 [Ikaeria aurantiellina]